MKKLLNTINENKAFIFPWVALVGLVILLASGLTYAYFDFVADSENESSMKLTATNLNISLSNPTIDLSDMMPIYDDYKDTKANTFTFTMSNTSKKLSGCVDLYLGVNSISEALVSPYFKFELKNNTTNTTTTGTFMNIADNRLLLKENETIPINTTYSYTLKIWYSYSDTVDQRNVSGASMSSKLISVAYGGACGSQVGTVYSTVGTTQFTATEDGYYRIETYNLNGDYASGEILLLDNEKLYFNVSDTAGTPTDVKCYYDEATRMCGTQGTQNANNSRIMYAKTDLSQSFISGYAGVNAPKYVNSSNELSYNTIHPTGKFFLNGNLKFGTNGKVPKVVVTYLGKYKDRNTKLDNVRYIKDCANGSTSNNYTHWVEIQAIKNGTNIAYGKSVTGITTNPLIVDGIIASNPYATSNSSGLKCVTVDLGKSYDLDEVAVWHYYANGRTYNDNVTSVSANNSTWVEVINKQEPESINGKRVSAYKSSMSLVPRYIAGTSNPREVRIGNEEFYVLNDIIDYSSLVSTNGNIYNYDSSKIILLAKYNLYVGQNCTSGSLCTPISTSTNGYGLQSVDAKGRVSSSSMIATVPFSGSSTSNGYWYNTSTSAIKTQYGTSYNASNIYDTTYNTAPNYSVAFINNAGNANYSIAYYVEEYINRLGINGIGRLLTYTEANAMTSAQRTNEARYWLGSANNNNSVWSAYSDGSVGSVSFYTNNYHGVRPIIVMDAADILPAPSFTRVGTDSTTGLPVVRSISNPTEEFYDLTNAIDYTSLINTNGNIYNYASDKSILLAKYNLYVGRNCTSSSASSCTPISTSATGYGLQSADAKGYVDSSTPRVGVVPFSGSSNSYGYWYDSANSTIYSKYGTSYNASNIYDTNYITAPNYSASFSSGNGNTNYSIAYYVEEYVDRLGIEGEGRLLTYTEANAMTTAQGTNGARFWLGSASSNNYVWNVGTGGALRSDYFSSTISSGVRPVLVVNTSNISG